MPYKTHLFRNIDELCDLLYRTEMHSLPTYALLGTANNTGLPPKVRTELAEFLLRKLRALDRAIWVTAGNATGAVQVLDDMITIVNSERTNTLKHHKLLGIMPEGQQNMAIATQVSDLFLLKGSHEFGDESFYIPRAVSFCGDGLDYGAYIAGGGEITQREVKFAVAEGVPLTFLKGTRRYADEIANNPGVLKCSVSIEEI